MSRLLIASEKKIVELFRKHNKDVGFEEFAFSQEGGAFLSTFKKMKIDNVNYYEEKEYFVAISGTLIYKGGIGTNSLKELLDDYRLNNDVNTLRSLIIGNYLCVIGTPDRIIVFCDPNNIYYGYYYQGERGWCISNSLYEMASAIGNGITMDEDVLLEEMYCRCIIGNDTVFKEIKRLLGDEAVVIYADGRFVVEKLRITGMEAVKEGTIEQWVMSFCSEIENVCKTIGHCFSQDVSIAMTGGVDSRTSLAGFVGAGLKPKLYYGKGNSLLAETKPQDEKICEEIADKLHLELEKMDWSMPDIIDKDWDELERKYGFLSRVYSGSKALLSSFESQTSQFITYGYFGESYSYDVPRKKTTFTIDDFLDYYIGTRVPHLAHDYRRFRENMSKKCTKIIDPENKMEGVYPIDKWILLELHMRQKKDSVLVNFSNQHRYSMAVLAEKDLLKYSYIPVKYKRDRTFLLKSINVLCPQLTEIPVFTHMEKRTIDKKRMKLTVPMKEYIKELIKRYVRSNFVKAFLIKVNQYKSGMKGASESSKTGRLKQQLMDIARHQTYLPHEIFAEKSTNLSLETRYLMTIELLQKKNHYYES